MKLRFQKWDMLAIAVALLLAAGIFLLFLPKGEAAAWAEIYQDGKLIKRLSLAEDGEFTVEGKYRNTVTVRDGKIAVTASNCPGEDCVGCGWQSAGGRSIVCLPNGLEIRVVSDSGDVDFVVG